MLKNRASRGLKVAMLTAMTLVGGGTVFTTCGLSDLRDNIIAGTLAYTKTSTTDFWSTLIPKWNTILTQPGT